MFGVLCKERSSFVDAIAIWISNVLEIIAEVVEDDCLQVHTPHRREEIQRSIVAIAGLLQFVNTKVVIAKVGESSSLGKTIIEGTRDP